MIGSNILLFPDTGPDFLRALRTGVLYSNQVCTLTKAEYPNLADHLKYLHERVYKGHFLFSPLVDLRVLRYLEFIQESQQEISLLKSEGVLTEIGGLTLHEKTAERVTKIAKNRRLWEKLGQAYWTWPPSLHDLSCFWAPADHKSDRQPQLLEEIREKCGGDFPETGGKFFVDGYRFIIIYGEIEKAMETVSALPRKKRQVAMAKLHAACEELGYPNLVEDIKGYEEREHQHQGLFAGYLTEVAALSEKMGTGLLTWEPGYQEALWEYRSSFLRRPKIQSRKAIEARLGQVAIERQIPVAHDIPLEKLLKLRKTRSSELEAFRSALGDVATSIDLEAPQEDIELQIQDVVSTRIDPALHDLRAALYSSRLDALVKTGRNWKSIAAATVAASLGVQAGAPLHLTALLATVGVVGTSILEGVLERKKLIHGSQWSLLLRLETLKRR